MGGRCRECGGEGYVEVTRAAAARHFPLAGIMDLPPGKAWALPCSKCQGDGAAAAEGRVTSVEGVAR